MKLIETFIGAGLIGAGVGIAITSEVKENKDKIIIFAQCTITSMCLLGGYIVLLKSLFNEKN